MKIILVIFSLLILSCSPKEKRSEVPESTEIPINQDSLLKVLIKSKTNANLKASILCELYIRGLVNQEGDEISFELPFNLHGLDCGAPDCYSTDISFKIKSTEPVEFPEIIKVNLFEHGCVDNEIRISGKFKLSEKTTELVNYFSRELESNLIIKKNGQLYYFPHRESSSVRVETIDKKFESHQFEDEEFVPYQSTIMTSQSKNYEYFIEAEK